MATAPAIAGTRRRWFRFSLRTVLLLVTVACVALGYVKRQRDRYVAIETIKSWGGSVEFAELRPVTNPHDEFVRNQSVMKAARAGQPRPDSPEQEPTGKAWQRYILGKYGKYHGSSVHKIALGWSIFSPQNAPMDIWVLNPLTEVKHLHLHEPINDAALQRLPRLPNLESLNLAPGAYVSDTGLECLTRMPKLENLQVREGKLSAKGLRHIADCRSLTTIRLVNCIVSDDGLASLSQLEHLTLLGLHGSTISDAAIPHLVKLRGLKTLQVSLTRLTEDGVQKLRAAMPNCVIAYH